DSLEEADLVQVLRRELRKREEAEEFAAKAGRTDLVTQNRAERSILEAYVPAQLGPTELEEAIRAAIAAGTPRQLGPIMNALREHHAGRFDGKSASELARRIIAAPAPRGISHGSPRSRQAQEGARGPEVRAHLRAAQGARGGRRARRPVGERRVRGGEASPGLRALAHRADREPDPRALDVHRRLDPAGRG